MNGKETQSLLLPKLGDILFVSVFLFLTLVAGSSLLADADTGYHIRAGQYMLEHRTVLRQDIFSHISPPIPWTAHEWLSEIIMAFIEGRFGLTGVVIFFAVVIAAGYALLFRVVRAHSDNILSPVVVVLLTIGASQIHWLARPHIFSLLLLILWYHLLDTYQRTGLNRLFFLPFLTLLWVNLHGGFIIGFVILGVYIAYNLLLRFREHAGQGRSHGGKAGVISLWAAGCAAAALVNPVGYHIFLFPFKLTSNRFIMDNVHEFLPPNFHEPMVFTWLLIFLVVTLAFSEKRLDLLEACLLVLFLYMSLYSARYIPLFAIIVAPVFIRQLESLRRRYDTGLVRFLDERARRIASADNSARGYLWSFAAFVLVAVLAAGGRIHSEFEKKGKPVDAVEFLKKERLPGNMFNNDEFGDYIIYAAWPQYKVFFDGRSDMYGTERIKEYFAVTRLEAGCDAVIEKYRINWVIFDAKSALSRYLLAREDWKLIYADQVSHIFVRNLPENERLIRKYPDVKPLPPKKESL